MRAREAPRAEASCGRPGRLSRSLLLSTLFAAVLALAGCGARSPAQSPSGPPNVLLVVIDALRADRLHCYGDSRETSPALDQMAAEGVLFYDAMAQGAETLNSIPLLLTGRRPGAAGMVWREASGLRYALPEAECPTLPELLKREGYATAMISVNPVLRTEPAVGRGFDTVEAPYDVGPAWVLASSYELSRRAAAWLERHARQEPFFLYLHYLDPHGQYQPPPAFCVFGRPGYTARDDKRNAALDQLPESLLAPGMTETLLMKTGLSRSDFARLSDLYDDEILYSDHCLGQLLAKLKDLGLYENTLIIVTADHGEAFLDHDNAKHRASLYQELIHVPLIIRGPGLSSGRSEDHLVETVDLAPTILEAVGAAIPGEMSGRSFYGALTRGEELADEIGLAELPVADSYALREGKWKLIATRGGKELYDLSQDPQERRDLCDSQPEQVARLTQVLEGLLSQRAGAKTSTRPLSERERKALESLGYLK